MFSGWAHYWKLQLSFPVIFQKNYARAPFEKTRLNQKHRKEDVVATVAATRSLH
jgi:hypothetical protein